VLALSNVGCTQHNKILNGDCTRLGSASTDALVFRSISASDHNRRTTMKRCAKVLLLAVVALAPVFASGCVYYPARPYRAAVWVPGHWGGNVWIRGRWR